MATKGLRNRFPYECEVKLTGETFTPILIDYDNEMVWRQIGQGSENGDWYDFDDVYFKKNHFFNDPGKYRSKRSFK